METDTDTTALGIGVFDTIPIFPSVSAIVLSSSRNFKGVPDVVVSIYGGDEAVFGNTSVPAEGVVLVSSGEP